MASPTWTWRMIVRGWFRESWIDASAPERDEIFAAWLEVHRGWVAKGCRLIFTMDDTSAVGRAGASHCNFYTVWEIPDPGVVHELLEPVWDEKGEASLRLAEFFTLEAFVGKPIVSMESGLGGTQPVTAATL